MKFYYNKHMNYIFGNTEYKNKLQERFIKYVKIWTESDGEAADKGIFPSTQRQWDFAKLLEQELKAFGLKQVQVTENCYVYGYLEGTDSSNSSEPVLLLAHMDTVDEVSGKDVQPVIKTTPEGDTIISSDGTTLLGGDDKAGVAEIMTAIEYLCCNPQIKHCPVEVIFSPDEETGHGMDKVPMELIKSKSAYTVDGGTEGEMETECFNAWAGIVEFTGKACHTGDAKAGGMINAAIMASEFVSLLPRNMAPETTENYEGFIAVMGISGTIENSSVEMLLRSFYIEEIEQEKQIITEIAEKIEQKYKGQVKVSFKQQYLNMKEKLDENPQVVARLEKAYKESGVEIIRKPIRGGTDGSRLTEMGIPTPNIFTGAHEYHSRNEWVSLNQMAKASDILVNLIIE